MDAKGNAAIGPPRRPASVMAFSAASNGVPPFRSVSATRVLIA